ncbi:MAG: DUF421 domain-containing protein [Clostridia bacterium]|jgi:uncharacterized membrane protein YcaP (DUF421 family)|nr:DUF421 domain-containing protein [Clostridia bacterium]
MLILALRTLILYLLVILVMRIMGKPQIGQLQPYELVVTIMISELAAVAMADTDIPLFSGIIPIITLMLGQITLAYWSLKNEKARAIICGQPSILVEKGIIKESELRRLRMNLNDLLEQLRVNNFPNIAEIDYAVLETNGDLSIIPKAPFRPVTVQDLNLNPPNPGLPLTLIIDGVIIKHNLEIANLTEEQLLLSVQGQGVDNIKDLFFASIDSTGQIFWQLKTEKVKS